MLTIEDFQPEHARHIIEENGRPTPLPLDEMITAYRSEGSCAMTVMHNGEPIACGGIINMKFRRGEAWLMTSDGARDHGVRVLGYVRRYLPALAKNGNFRRIQAICFNLADDRLFHVLDFELEGLLKCFGPDGEDALMYARIYGGAR